MAIDAGDKYHRLGHVVAAPVADTVEAGDAVAWEGGELTVAGETDDPAGVASEDGDGDESTVHVNGAVVANVEAGTTAGHLVVSAEDGVLANGDGDWFALFDEGEVTPDGTAPVVLK